MRHECFGQSRPQDGRQHTQNRDAYLIGRSPVPWAAILDGAGNAEAVAKRAAALLEHWFRETSLGQLLRDDAWAGLARRLDSALTGGPESTVVAVAAFGDQIVGVAAGDSRAYLVPIEGNARLVTAEATKPRLGSGEVRPLVFRETLRPRDVLLLLSDGAWGPLGLGGVDRAVRSALCRHFSETPDALLDAASRRGRGDDMTAVALRALAGESK
jgi:serine/threonine protein phosphatase PrpC